MGLIISPPLLQIFKIFHNKKKIIISAWQTKVFRYWNPKGEINFAWGRDGLPGRLHVRGRN